MEESKTCSFFVQRKKRNCKMLVKSGKRFCGQHLVEDTSEIQGEFKRIKCPLDPKHSCFEHRLKQHLEVCNARVIDDLPFIKRDNNIGLTGEEPPKTSLSVLSDSELLSFIKKVEDLHTEYIGEIEEAKEKHEVLEKEMDTPGFGPSVIRHLAQNSSILGHLNSSGFLDTSAVHTCFIEFGAGRGQLTHWLTESVSDVKKALFVLIDRGAQRYKFDAKLKYNEELSIRRLRVDIQHLALEGVDDISSCKQIVGFGKHLCGGATDLALRCLSTYKGQLVSGIVVALCCHHRCTWNTYAGCSFLQESGFSSNEFYTLTALTSWATCNSKDVESINSEEKGNITEDDLQTQNTTEADIEGDGEKQGNENRYTRLGLSAQYREEVGRKAKQILDFGRVKYLNDCGFQSRLVQYVDKDSTLENIALVAVNKMYGKT